MAGALALLLLWRLCSRSCKSQALRAKTYLQPLMSAQRVPRVCLQVLPYTPQMKEALGSTGAWLVAAGGIAYTVGAIIYARRYPDPWVRTTLVALS